MKNTRVFYRKKNQFLELKFSIYFNRLVFVMKRNGYIFRADNSIKNGLSPSEKRSTPKGNALLTRLPSEKDLLKKGRICSPWDQSFVS